MQPFKRIAPGGQVSAAEFNRALDDLERILWNLNVTPPLELDRSDAGINIRLNQPRRLVARLTGLVGSGSGEGSGAGSGLAYCLPAYTWVPLAFTETCTADNPADVQGDDDLPALCLSNRDDVPTDATNGDGNGVTVELIQAPGWPYYVFWYGASIPGGHGSGSGPPGCGPCANSIAVRVCNVDGSTSTKRLTITGCDADGRPLTLCVDLS